MRIHIHDVLAKIAQVSGGYSGHDIIAAVDEYWSHYPYELRISITNDVEATELDFLNKYGSNATMYFSLSDYAHGLQLAKELHLVIMGSDLDTTSYDGSNFNVGDKLYLFVYVQKEKSEEIVRL